MNYSDTYFSGMKQKIILQIWIFSKNSNNCYAQYCKQRERSNHERVTDVVFKYWVLIQLDSYA